jgi:hypothetical protein
MVIATWLRFASHSSLKRVLESSPNDHGNTTETAPGIFLCVARCKPGKQSYTCRMPIMRCPACDAILREPAVDCPQCRFTLRNLDSIFGAVPLHSRYLSDRSATLTTAEIERLRELLQRFERKFPQALFSVFITELPEKTNIKEYAFWLANRSQFSSVEAIGSGNFDLLLVIDPVAESAALTIGYGLEKFLSEEDLRATLAAATPSLRGAQLEHGIRICIEEMTRRLSELCKSLEVEKQSAGKTTVAKK